MSLAQSAQTALLRTFDHCTLQDNWCEDRLMAPDEIKFNERKKVVRPYEADCTIPVPLPSSQYTKPVADAPYLERHVLGPTPKNRITPWDVEKMPYNTTLGDSMCGEVPYKQPRRSRPMVTARNLHKTINVNRAVEGIPSQGFGSTLGHGTPEPPPAFETTTAYNYTVKPAHARAALAASPLPEQGDDTRHVGGYPANVNPNAGAVERGPIYSTSHQFFKRQTWERDAMDTTVTADGPRGRAGARGELIRNPEADGSMQGRSVWSDEYAKVGVQISSHTTSSSTS